MKITGKSLVNLECGNLNSCYNHSTELAQIQGALQKKLGFFVTKLLSCNYSSDSARYFIPFYARNILEISATALLARIDPFRAIITYKVQNDASYSIEAPSNVAINWSKDILADDPPPAKGLWHFENKIKDFNRALFSKYQGEIIWKPAFLELTDYISTHPQPSSWLQQLLADDETAFFERYRSNARQLFSSFSKGVHAESLTEVSLLYDEITLTTLSEDLLRWCCILGLLSHFSPYILLPFSQRIGLTQFLQAERMVANALQ